MSEVAEKIRSRGHWNVVIRPASFVVDRIPYETLDEIIPSVAVRMRGWPVPYANEGRHELLHGPDWVGQDVDAVAVAHFEAWRLFASGQFVQLRSVSADWRSEGERTNVPAGLNSVIEVWEILYYLTEVFELAGRLALGPAGDETMVVSTELKHLENRGLVLGLQGRVPFLDPYKARVPSLAFEVELSREGLVAGGRHAAAEMSRDYFLRFGWKPSVDQVLELQRELTEK